MRDLTRALDLPELKEREISAVSTKLPDPPPQPLSLSLRSMSLVCALVLAPVTFAAIYYAPELANDPLYAAAFAGVSGLLAFLVIFVLAICLQQRESATPARLAPQHRPVVTPIVKLQAADAVRDERRARMASLIAEIRTHSRITTAPDQARTETAAAITKRLASLSTDSAHCASRAADFLAAADLGAARAEEGARTLAALECESGDTSEAASRAVAQTVDAIRNLARRSDEILEIVDLIETVAAQTSLLSLNAIVDAVRIGEETGGFAAVAQDVGSMAGQSGRAADRVAANVMGVRQAIAAASAAMATLATCLEGMESAAPGAAGPVARSRETLRVSVRQGIDAIARIGVLAEEAGKSIAGVADAMADLVLTVHHRTVVAGDIGEDRAT